MSVYTALSNASSIHRDASGVRQLERISYLSLLLSTPPATHSQRKRYAGTPETSCTPLLLPPQAKGTVLTAHPIYSVAGSETTASFLCGVTWYLGRGPAAYKKLTDEIRSAFSSYEDINGRATEHLVYLKAVIEEGLRLYPPVGLGAPRVSPGETVDECWVSKGVSIRSSGSYVGS